jgi:hypothetical protein
VSGTPDLGEIAERLGALSRELDKVTGQAEELDRAAVISRHGWELEFARAFLGADGAVDVRKQKAVIATGDAKLESELDEARLRACKARIATIKVQIDTGRSLGAALRAEVSLAGSGHAP